MLSTSQRAISIRRPPMNRLRTSTGTPARLGPPVPGPGPDAVPAARRREAARPFGPRSGRAPIAPLGGIGRDMWARSAGDLPRIDGEAPCGAESRPRVADPRRVQTARPAADLIHEPADAFRFARGFPPRNRLDSG